MSKPRRPKGPRPDWAPKPALNADGPALRAVPPPTDTAIPDVAVAKATETVAASEPDGAAPEAPAEVSVPVAALVPPVTIPPVTAPSAAPVARDEAAEHLTATSLAATSRAGFTPNHRDGTGIGSTIARYMRGESEAALAHLRALSQAGSPTELMRLQMGEVQRAADASLTCWSDVIRKASRLVAFR
ncbi:hypothetical protein [Methylobacterium brachiatum]|uniref:hypothetical protein n=1 Tax=Methylobacterium brachiatum TaxID=269660 RepID=UPI0008E1D2A0|nr:hypothetical protein [Methylobacterium brachiatum]SFJ08149.1 Phasin protein [Methylobacterium brachiatum]